MRHARLGYPVGLVALAGLYYAAAKTGYLLEFAGPVAAIIWLPVGVGIAFLYLGGLRYWPGVLIGDLLANDYTALPIGSALGQTCGNMLEVILAVLLLRRLVRAWFAARQRSRRRRDRRGDRGGGDGQRHGWSVSLLSGEVIDWRRGADRLAHVVARRFVGRADRRSARTGLVPTAAGRLARTGGRLEAACPSWGPIVGVAEFASRSSSPLMYLVFPLLIWAPYASASAARPSLWP